jgi:hypothetical protein
MAVGVGEGVGDAVGDGVAVGVGVGVELVQAASVSIPAPIKMTAVFALGRLNSLIDSCTSLVVYRFQFLAAG